MKQQTRNKTNFRFRPGGEGGPDPFARRTKKAIKKRSLWRRPTFIFNSVPERLSMSFSRGSCAFSSVRPSVRQSVRLFARPSVCPSARPSVRPLVRPFVRPFVGPRVRLESRSSLIGPKLIKFNPPSSKMNQVRRA